MLVSPIMALDASNIYSSYDLNQTINLYSTIQLTLDNFSWLLRERLRDFREKYFANTQEWTKSYIELIASYVHPKTGNHLRSHLRVRPGKKIRSKFLPSTSLLCKILPANLGACKPTFYTIYTSHLRWNSTMRHCFYHKDLGQKAVFHNFAIQIALIQYSEWWKYAWAFS